MSAETAMQRAVLAALPSLSGADWAREIKVARATTNAVLIALLRENCGGELPASWMGERDGMVRCCSWCPDAAVTERMCAKVGLPVTHGICERCNAAMLLEANVA